MDKIAVVAAIFALIFFATEIGSDSAKDKIFESCAKIGKAELRNNIQIKCEVIKDVK